jgi:predicted FMN-binding regulatory protein PaiB
MFMPPLFKIEDVADAHGLMRAHPFAVLVTTGSDGLFATHQPTELQVD